MWGNFVVALPLLLLLNCVVGQELPEREPPVSGDPTGDEPPEVEPISRFDMGYLIMAPKVMTAGTTETVCIRLLNMTGPITLTISLGEDSETNEVMASLQPYFMEFPFACLDLEIPAIDGAQKQAVFQVEGFAEYDPSQTFTDSKKVWIKGNNWESYIQTDKSIYKPGQTVKFRMLTIDQNFRPDLSQVSKIWIEAPSGIHMAQWLNVTTEENDGIVDLELPMTSDPALGEWKIRAVHQGKDITQTFTVDEYVLPKFEIDVQAPSFVLVNESRMDVKICAKYTYGQPVRGSIKAAVSVSTDGWSARPRATIKYDIQDTGKDGCQDIVVDVYRLELNSTDFSLWNARINVAVEFTERATGVMLSELKDVTKVSTDALTLEFRAPETFKPGVPYHGKIFVTNPDGSPAGGRTIRLTVDTNQGHVFDEMLVSLPSGVIDFTAKNISIQSSSLSLYAMAPGYSNRPSDYDYRSRLHFLYDPAVAFSAQPQFSPSGSFIQIAPILETVDIGSTQTLTVDFTARDAEKESIDFRFLFMSRGNILRDSVHSLESVHPDTPERAARQAEVPADDVPSEIFPPLPSDSDFIIDPSERFSSETSEGEEPIVVVQPGQLNTVQAQITISQEMMPVTRVLVYYIRKDGEVVADSMTFKVQEMFENEVTMDFASDEAAPGEMTKLKIQAAPGSLCGIGVVDKSVQLLGGDNQLKKSKIFSSLEKHQLSERDGELDPSQHCPEPIPWWSRLPAIDRRRKRTVIYRPPQTYKDASLAFKQMGLVFLTNIQVETRPCISRDTYYRGRGIPGPEVAFLLPQAVPVVFDAQPEVAFNKQEVTADVNEIPEEAAPVIVRTYFPETWLWDLVRLGSESSEAEVDVEVPDTITDWVGSGFCTSTEYGVGISNPVTLRAFQPFFASYNLPYSVIRGEEVPVSVTVFNYLSECLVVELTLQDSEDFVLKDKDSVQRICVCGAESKTAIFNVSFSSLGMIPIEVHAVSIEDTTSLCGNDVVSSAATGFSDGIRRELLVEAEGVEEEYTINSYFCPEETRGVFFSVKNLALPINVVKDSQKAKITISGDLMGPTLSNLDKLLRVPTGCGEQNMLGMVPNIFVMQYLESTEQITPAIADKAKANMRIGYQRELNYRRDDNSYSAFGMSDPEGSTWLTAFVVRSYAQASEYIFIDKEDLHVSIGWLKEQQDNGTGCFQSRGKLCHKAMSGGVNNELTLTAYVVITLLEAKLPQNDPAVVDGLRCLADGIPTLSDTYTTTQMAYALALAESPDLPVVMAMLEEAAIKEDGVKYWKSSRPQTTDRYGYYGIPAQDIEMTGYALLAYMQQAEGGDALVAGNPIARWIIAQRNSQGGFSSTQDTVIGLQALASYADLAYTGGVSIHLKVRTHPQKVKNSFRVMRENRLIMQEMTLDAKNVPTRIIFEGRGPGCALLQTAVSYNVIPKKPTTPAFTISYDVREIEKPKRCSQYSMQVCTSYTGDDNVSNMALLRVKMQTGFVPVKSTLSADGLMSQTKAFRKVEVDGKMINFYFDELAAEQTCLVFSIEKSIDVKEVKDGAVTILDYYEQSLSLSEMVKLPCPEEPNYQDPTFQDTMGEPLEPKDPLILPEPRGPFLPEPQDPFARKSPLGVGEEPVVPDVVVLDDLDISSFNQCPEGRVFADGIKKCVAPVGDACQDGTTCEEGYTCVDTDAGIKCEDLDECSKYNDICKGDSICTNIEGSYLCAVLDCGQGYQISAQGQCEDVNECDTPDVCGVFGICLNRDGSYDCLTVQVECIDGFRLDPSLECQDIDECAENPDICGPGNLCTNSLGSYACAITDCGFGYIKDESGSCVDVNECEDPTSCEEGATCINEDGGFVCTSIGCLVGFKAVLYANDELNCTDIDECAETPDICGPGNICANTIGSYVCAIVDCGLGYIKDENGDCVDVNECEDPDVCPPGEMCVDMPGQYACVGCADGFRAINGPTGDVECVDINECEEVGDICGFQQTCVNIPGAHGCEGVVVEPPAVIIDLPGSCGLPLKTGRCRGNFPKYGFNSKTERCEKFVYGGCDGNDNQFDTLDACTAACKPQPSTGAEPLDPDTCSLPLVTGKCRGNFPKFGYVAKSKTCEQFVYGGCDGNSNNFDTMDACMQACGETAPDEVPLPELCTLPMMAGLCEAAMPMYAYNPETGECEQFIYGGCGGNVNRFETEAECTDMCGSVPRDIPPFTPKKFPDDKVGQCLRYIDDNGPCVRECLGDNAECPGNFLCCFNGCGYQCIPFTLEEAPEPKEGVCPSNPFFETVACDNDNVVTDCYYDYNCDGEMKCCSDGCNSVCTEPVRRAVDPILPPHVPKPGECPVQEPSLVAVCVDLCDSDQGCLENQKCCSIGCGKQCMDPVLPPPKPEPKPGECPVVESDGFFVCVQECDDDIGCDGDMKCCSNGCGKTCMEPMAPKPGVCPMVDLGTGGICSQECDNDHACEGNKKCCTNGCGNTCMPAYDPAVNNFSECPLVTDIGICSEECSVDADCGSQDQICCFNGCGHTCVGLTEGPSEVIPPISLDCPYCLTSLTDLPEDITALICQADIVMVIKWKAMDNRVRFLRDLITDTEVTQPSRLLDIEESCPCRVIGSDERVIIVGQSDRILTGKGKSRSVTLGVNSFAIRNDAKLKKQLEDIRSNCP